LTDDAVAKKIPIRGFDTPTPSPNAEDATYFHVQYLGAGGIIVEGIANQSALPKDTQFTFYTLPLKFQGRDGSPVRAIAILD
jgi:kynurenine formamidase